MSHAEAVLYIHSMPALPTKGPQTLCSGIVFARSCPWEAEEALEESMMVDVRQSRCQLADITLDNRSPTFALHRRYPQQIRRLVLVKGTIGGLVIGAYNRERRSSRHSHLAPGGR
jgi:hypothetical protein